MIEQSFALSDIPRVITLTFLEMLLSADNAIVLGVLTHSLPVPLRRKALYIGLVSAFILRAGALLAISFLLESIWFQIFGGLYLVYLSVRYFTKKGGSPNIKPSHSFWKVVFLVEIFDIIFAIDSIIAGLAFINSSFSKIWIVYLGGILGIIGMRYAADIFSSLIDRFPNLEKSAYLVVGWIGLKLNLSALQWDLPAPLFWSVTALFFLLGFLKQRRK